MHDLNTFHFLLLERSYLHDVKTLCLIVLVGLTSFWKTRHYTLGKMVIIKTLVNGKEEVIKKNQFNYRNIDDSVINKREPSALHRPP